MLDGWWAHPEKGTRQRGQVGRGMESPRGRFLRKKVGANGARSPPAWSHPQFSYVDADGSPVSVVQMTFLKLLSATARQSFTYSCQNSAGWLDEAAGDHSRSVRFLGANGEELSFNQMAAATITVPYDGCRVRGGAGAGRSGEGPWLPSCSSAILSSPRSAPEGTDEDPLGVELFPSGLSASVGHGGY